MRELKGWIRVAAYAAGSLAVFASARAESASGAPVPPPPGSITPTPTPAGPRLFLMGLYLGKVTPDIAAASGDRTLQGWYVKKVTPGSPAETAGVISGDILVEANGEPYMAARVYDLRARGVDTDIRIYRPSLHTFLHVFVPAAQWNPDAKAKSG